MEKTTQECQKPRFRAKAAKWLVCFISMLGISVFLGQRTSAAAIPGRPDPNSLFPLRGTFVNFYRPNMTPEKWHREFLDMRALDIDTAVIYAAGRIATTTSATGTPEHFIYDCSQSNYPAGNFSCDGPDNIGMALKAAKAANIRVYIGLMQTADAWYTGAEFDVNNLQSDSQATNPLPYFNRRLADDLYQTYAVNQGYSTTTLAGWFFPQELWMNWVYSYGASDYYGTKLLADFTDYLHTHDGGLPVIAAPAFQINPPLDGMPQLPPATSTALSGLFRDFASSSKIDLLALQDGYGSVNSSLSTSTLGSYYQKIKQGVDQAASTQTQLWSTVELFDSNPSLPPQQYPPAQDFNRIVNQITAEQPYTLGMLSWIFGDQMSPQAYFYPTDGNARYWQYGEYYSACQAPQTGNWTIASSCIIPDALKPPGSLAINNPAAVTVKPGAKLLLDLKHQKLTVKKGARLVIKKGGVFRQVKSTD